MKDGRTQTRLLALVLSSSLLLAVTAAANAEAMGTTTTTTTTTTGDDVVWLEPEVVARRVVLRFGAANATTVAIPRAALAADADYVLTVSCSAATPADVHTAVLNGARAAPGAWHGDNQRRLAPRTLAHDVTLVRAGVPTPCVALRVRAAMRGVRRPGLPVPAAVLADLVVSRVRLGLPQRAWPVLATAAAAAVVVSAACTVLVARLWTPLPCDSSSSSSSSKDE